MRNTETDEIKNETIKSGNFNKEFDLTSSTLISIARRHLRGLYNSDDKQAYREHGDLLQGRDSLQHRALCSENPVEPA